MRLSRIPVACAAFIFLAPTGAAEIRSSGPHVHGRATLDVAAIGGELEIILQAPAMDIVGFEHDPSTAQQETVLREALERLRRPGEVFGLPARADCHAHSVRARRVADEGRHGGGEHEQDGHEHEDHHGPGDRSHEHGGDGTVETRDAHGANGDDRHAERDRKHQTGHDRKAGYADGEAHGAGEHHQPDRPAESGDEAAHAEVHAHYRFECADPGALDGLEVRLFDYFDSLEEIRVQVVTDAAQSAARLRPGAARLEW